MSIGLQSESSVRFTVRARRLALGALLAAGFAVGFLTADLGLPGWSL